MSVDFNTTEYEFSHGHAPRGRGSWAFFFSRTNMRAGVVDFWTPGSTTYAEAKKMVRDEVRRRFGKNACGDVYVGS